MQELKQTPAGLFVVKYASERPNPKDFDSAGIFDAADRYFEELKAWQSSAVSYPVYWGEVKKFMDFAAVESMTLPGGSPLVVALTAGIRIPDENVSIKRVTPAGAAERVHMAFFVPTPTPEVKGEDKNWSGDEVLMASNFLIALRLTKAKIPPEELMKVVNNWERIKKAIRILNYDFST